MRAQQLQFGLTVLLAIVVVISSVWAVKTKHQARQLFIEVESLNRERDRLLVDWGRLQIEQSMYGTHPRIESLARERLNLSQPIASDVIVVAEPTQ